MYTENNAGGNSLHDKIANNINNDANSYFGLHSKLRPFKETMQELLYEFKECANATSQKKTGWIFYLFILTPILGVFDVKSVSPFLAYLSSGNSNFIIGTVFYLLSWALFICIELGISFVIIHAKSNPAMRLVSFFLAGVVSLLPPFLIYMTYAITEDKTTLLLYETVALMLVSFVLHLVFFLVAKEVWAAINYCKFSYRNWKLKIANPKHEMHELRNELQTRHFPDFDRYVVPGYPGNAGELLNNRAWYLKRKFRGDCSQEFDLSDYDQNTNYAPGSGGGNTNFSYNVKS